MPRATGLAGPTTARVTSSLAGEGPPDFDADMLDSYEIGYKGETEDRRWAMNVAAYYIDWDNVVIRVFNATTNISYYDNAAGMKVKGAELALTARPTGGLSIVGSFAYTDSYLTEANTDLGAAKGERYADGASLHRQPQRRLHV